MGEKHSTVQSEHLGPKAKAVKEAAEHLAGFLPGKVMAYGAAHDIQPHIWAAMLEQYRDGENYAVPAALFDRGHVPRITRVLDRLIRIVSNPAIDPMGENPWLDAAGDCIAGMAMQGVGEQRTGDGRIVEKGGWDERIIMNADPQHTTAKGGVIVVETEEGTHEYDYMGSGRFTPRAMQREAEERIVKQQQSQGGQAYIIDGEQGRTVFRNTWDADWGRSAGSPFVPGPAPCAHCGSREYGKVDFLRSVCDMCPTDRQRAKGGWPSGPHPAETRIWNEGPIHPDEGI